MVNLTDSDYEQVRASGSPSPNPKVAQEFLDEVDFSENRKYIRRVVYDPVGKFIFKNSSLYPNPGYAVNNNSVSCVSPKSFDRWFTKKSDLYVFPSLFYYSFNFFQSILVDHEGYHAAQNAQRGSLISDNQTISTQWYFHYLKETLACMAQLENSEKRGLCLKEKNELRDIVSESIFRFKSFSDGRDIATDLEMAFCDLPRDKLSRELVPKLIVNRYIPF